MMSAHRKSVVGKSAKSLEIVADNPFESRGITHKKHDVFNRKVKGEKRNVARARGQATQRREKTLLVDYERSHKANSFRDRRFGEDDANLALEEKMWARMQKERNQRSRSRNMFNLGDDTEEGETLTHRGRALGNDLHDYQRSDEDDDLNAEVVDRLHFGGDAGDRRHAQQGEKTRQELLNEIIAQSKERKLEKARGKEEQESERERLDEGMGELLDLLNRRPSKSTLASQKGQSDDYDLIMRELAYEARAQATDRLQTPAEAARAEKMRLEALEKERMKRMSNQAEDVDAETAKPQSFRRRRKGPNDDELSGEEQGGSAGTADGPGWGLDYSDDSDLFGSDSDSDMDGDSDAIDEVALRHTRDVAGIRGQTDDSDVEGDHDASMAVARSMDTVQSNCEDKEIPYVLDCPSSYEDLLTLLTRHAANAEDINTIVDRIHKNHSINLDSRNKEKMHNFYEVLLKRFRRVGGQVGPLSSAASEDRAKQLDFLSGLIYDITSEMPEVAASLWHRFLGVLHQRMMKAMTDLRMGACGSGYWPGAGSLVQLKLLVHVFPCTDFRHPVVTPALLHLSQCLSQCPVKTAPDLIAGVFSCGLVLQCSLGAGRVAPEALVFLSSSLSLFAPPKSSVMMPPAFRSARLDWLRSAAGMHKGGKLPSFSLGMGEVSTPVHRQLFATSLLATLFKLVRQVGHQLRGNLAFPELFGPIQGVLLQIQPEVKPALPKALGNLTEEVLQMLDAATKECLSRRNPLYWRAVDPPALEALVPKFQESYKMKKDGHKDAEQTKLKQLSRQVKRERKGAMRELKRDAIFLEHVKTQKVKDKAADRKRKLRNNLAWLEEQQAVMNQQVKLGGKLLKGGGSASTKKAKIGRGY